MAKKSTYTTIDIWGNKVEFETTSPKAALAKAAMPTETFAALISNATLKSAVRYCKMGPSGYSFESAGGTLKIESSDLAMFNETLERLGFKGLAVTHNMLNPGASSFLIDADTPHYCNPAYESYHSM